MSPSSQTKAKRRAAETGGRIDDAARCRAFFEQDAVGIFEADATGRFLLVNRALCVLTGYPESELLKMRHQDLVDPDESAGGASDGEPAPPATARNGCETRWRRKDRTTVWVYLGVTQIAPAEEKAPALLAVVLDISERRKAEEAARKTADRYQGLFNSVDAGFCVVEVLFDEDRRPIDYVFLEVNAQFASVAGLPLAKGRRMRELAPEHEQRWFDIYGRIALTGEPIRFEQEARALKKWFSVYAFRVGDPEERQVAILFEDITARKLSERRQVLLAELADRLAQLRTERDILRTTVEAVGRFLGVERCTFLECLEAENRVVVAQEHVAEGGNPLPREMNLFDFGGMDWWRELSRGEFAIEDVAADPLTRARATAYAAVGIRSYCAQPFREEGPWTIVLSVADKLVRQWSKDDLKLLDHVVARVWPLVERARHERAVAVANESLEQRVAERTARLRETIAELEAFSYSISHDLRAPLRAMQTYASILVGDAGAELSPQSHEYLRRIKTAAERMDQLIRDVLVFSRVARDSMPLERIELGSFLAGIIESYPGLSVATAEIEIVSPLGAVRANQAGLTQCLSNLLGNAIKFVPEGVKPRIRIWSGSRGDRLRLFIRDNGVGIQPEAQEKIFGMFYQIDQARPGTGIGLAVVRKAAERMGGQVGVTSAPGEGSTFWLDLASGNGGTVL